MLKDDAYNALINMIWSGQIQANKIYSVTKIAKGLNISRTPLRDALQRLSDEHHVDILPSRGFCLHKLTEEEMKQRYHLSICLESYCVACLIEKYKIDSNNPFIKKLEECIKNMDEGLKRESSFKEKYNFDNNFHKTLIDSLDDHFPDYLSLKEHGFINIPELHLYAKHLDMSKMLEYNKLTLKAVKEGNYELGYKNLLNNASYVFDIYMTEMSKEKSNEI